MSFITPKEYKEISENMGEAFAKIRKAINNPQEQSESAYGKIKTALITVANSEDSSVVVSENIDPIGSIMSDLGASWQSSANDNFTNEKAISNAASFFSIILNKLNNHVKKRTINPTTGIQHKTIGDWYKTYAFTPGEQEYSLFWNDGNPPDELDFDSYFSQDFEDLCDALKITIPNEYKKSTYSS